MAAHSTEDYARRRDFTRTGEPRGAAQAREDGEERGRPVFVAQIHDARSLHVDFRLECDGVLKSWAVPKGPSPDPQDKRLASPTEDHPLEYRFFEGVIPEGNYGAGAVIVWDEGTYLSLTSDRRGQPVPMAEALEQGHASFRLSGRKLHGAYALTRMQGGAGGGGREAWLLVKENDRYARRGRTPDPRRARSVRSGRTLRQVAREAAGEG